MPSNPIFKQFDIDIQNVDLPNEFTFPFYYSPHKLVEIAANKVQEEILQRKFAHDFSKVGKMFGVLVVQKASGTLGFISAYSGKIGESNKHEGFVPPVFDILDEEGFYRKGEAELNELNALIEEKCSDRIYQQARQNLESAIHEKVAEIACLKTVHKENKKKRRKLREENIETSSDAQELGLQLDNQSKREHFELKDCNKKWKVKIEKLKNQVQVFENEIQFLKNKRASKSANLQNAIFKDYNFLNAVGELKSLLDIFTTNLGIIPPAGAGECAAPKLLQYAYINKLKPLALGEFWWGASPKTTVRTQAHFYPSCRTKCEPILGHMLQGLNVEANPLLNSNSNLKWKTVFEDDYLLVIDKPEGILSVPGKQVVDSIEYRLQNEFQGKWRPYMVHRLDRATSGLLIVAKEKFVHEHLQKQFANHTVKKRYEALVDGNPISDLGRITLPLRVDLDNRPQQLVCYEYGKSAYTEYKVVATNESNSLVFFFPKTGRTHQLRVHSAHTLGLQAPIVGDDIYGKSADRLYLHAAEISFEHPVSGEEMQFVSPSGFEKKLK